MGRRWFDAAVILVAGACSAAAADHKPTIRGIGLGVPADEIMRVSQLPCLLTKTNDLHCQDQNSVTNVDVAMSGDKPPVALSVTSNFCSTADAAEVLRQSLIDLGVPKAKTRSNPNGTGFDISDTIVGNLDASEGACKEGGKLYRLSIQDDAMLKLNGEPPGAAGVAQPGQMSTGRSGAASP